MLSYCHRQDREESLLVVECVMVFINSLF